MIVVYRSWSDWELSPTRSFIESGKVRQTIIQGNSFSVVPQTSMEIELMKFVRLVCLNGSYVKSY